MLLVLYFNFFMSASTITPCACHLFIIYLWIYFFIFIYFRMSDLVENDALVVSRRGWWRKTVNWAKKHWGAIKKGIKIAADIIKAIWGKK